MSAQAFDFAVNGGWVNLHIPGDLPFTHAIDDFAGDVGISFGEFLPICGGEGLG